MPVYRTPSYVRSSVSHGCPTSMPAAHSDFFSHKLSMIPPTPAFEEALDPFDSVPPVPQVPEVAVLQPSVVSVMSES